MNTGIRTVLSALFLLVAANFALAAPALQVLGRDFVFPNKLEGLPARLSDFPGLQINTFETGDGVKLSYWEAGTGKPLVFIPGWSANGAEYINVLYLLAKSYHVLRPRPAQSGVVAARRLRHAHRAFLGRPQGILGPSRVEVGRLLRLVNGRCCAVGATSICSAP